MNKLFHHQQLARIVLFLWLFTSLSGMHAHYCFDGLEPPVSVHFEMAGDHPDHSDEATHIDADNKPSQIIALKIFNIDFLFLLAAFLVIACWPLVLGQRFSLSKTPTSWLAVFALRPPLRAPPVVTH